MEITLLLTSLGLAGLIMVASKVLDKKQEAKMAIKNDQNNFDEEED